MGKEPNDMAVVALGTFILASIAIIFAMALMALPAAAILGLLSVLGVLSFSLLNYIIVLGCCCALFILIK